MHYYYCSMVSYCTQFMPTYKRTNDVNESNVPGGIFLILLLCKNLFIKYKISLFHLAIHAQYDHMKNLFNTYSLSSFVSPLNISKSSL